MTTNIDRAVNVIAGAGNCDFCEMFDDPGESCAYCIRSAETFAQALADAGLLMEDLPKPDSKGRWATELFGGGVFAIREPGVVDLVRKDGVISNRAEVLRREALRMLAAANYAEQEQRNG